VFETKADTNPVVEIKEDDYAYMIYTSGSTGKPKGAINKHKAISNFILWLRNNFKLDEGDAVLHKTPFSFDVSLCEIFQPLVCGAKVVIAKPEGHKDTTYLMNVIKEENIKLIHFVPSMLNLFLEEPGIEELNSLKYVICIGEMLNKEVEKDLYSKLDCQLSNLYGPAETAVVVTAWKCEKKDAYAFVPIGRPVANTQIYIVDSMLNPVPKGVVGEILIGGLQVGAGYFNRDELTSQRFIEDIFLKDDNKLYRTGDLGRYTEDGQIDFIGRMDHQVKINGLRIELGEIEESLRSHEGIKEAIVSVYKNNIGLDSLGAYVWVREEYIDAIEEQELIDHISEALPTYMIPSQILILDKFPLNPSGKVDRKKLPEFSPFKAITSVEMVKPENELEQAIHDVICEILGVEEISVIANLMDYGMGSLSAIRIVSKLRNTIGIEVDLAVIFDNKSITNISDKLLEACMDEVAMGELDKI
jgi:amino acid adenylation domain-containing protein